jgi:hypothetical protein
MIIKQNYWLWTFVISDMQMFLPRGALNEQFFPPSKECDISKKLKYPYSAII